MLSPATVARQPSRRTVGIELAATAQVAAATPRPALWGPLCCYHNKHNRPAWLGARRARHNAGRHEVSPEAQTSVVNSYPYTRASPGPIVETIGVGKIVPPAMYNTLPRTEPATNCLAVGRLLPAVRDGWG